MKRSNAASAGVESKADARLSTINPVNPPSYQLGGGYNSLPENEHPDADTAPLDVAISPLDPTMVQVSVSDPTLAGLPGPSERVMACHRYSRAVRVLAVLDAVVVLYGASAFTPLILMLWGPIAGYVSSTFQLRAAYAFFFYYGLRVFWDIGWLLSGGITWLIVWVFLVTDAAASGLVYFYLTLLRKCTPAEVEQLRDPGTSWSTAFFPLAVPGTPSSSSS